MYATRVCRGHGHRRTAVHCSCVQKGETPNRCSLLVCTSEPTSNAGSLYTATPKRLFWRYFGSSVHEKPWQTLFSCTLKQRTGRGRPTLSVVRCSIIVYVGMGHGHHRSAVRCSCVQEGKAQGWHRPSEEFGTRAHRHGGVLTASAAGGCPCRGGGTGGRKGRFG